MTEALVLIDHPDPTVTLLTLNRPSKRNALSTPLINALCEAITGAEADPRTRALVFTGAGPVFCAGMDLSEAGGEGEAGVTAAGKAVQGVARLLSTIVRSRLLTIAAVHGAALAGGAGLMSSTDIVVAAEGCQIGYPEVLRGLVAGVVTTFLVRQVGDRAARELLLLGKPVLADRALAMGLINRVVPSERVLPEALAIARDAIPAGPEAIARSKLALAELSPVATPELLERALQHFLGSRKSVEAAEGLRAFLEKRPPKWSVKN